MKKILLSMINCLFASPLFAASITNQELLKACKDKSPSSQNFCYEVIISAANSTQFYRNIVDIEDEYLDICFPDTISNKELVDLYIAWAEKNLSVGAGPAFVGVSSSFSTKYSCEQKKR